MICLDQSYQEKILEAETDDPMAKNRGFAFLAIFPYIFRQNPMHTRN